jgi:hypothetical protein
VAVARPNAGAQARSSNNTVVTAMLLRALASASGNA